jgi:hypothetical protein
MERLSKILNTLDDTEDRVKSCEQKRNQLTSKFGYDSSQFDCKEKSTQKLINKMQYINVMYNVDNVYNKENPERLAMLKRDIIELVNNGYIDIAENMMKHHGLYDDKL